MSRRRNYNRSLMRAWRAFGMVFWATPILLGARSVNCALMWGQGTEFISDVTEKRWFSCCKRDPRKGRPAILSTLVTIGQII